MNTNLFRHFGLASLVIFEIKELQVVMKHFYLNTHITGSGQEYNWSLNSEECDRLAVVSASVFMRMLQMISMMFATLGSVSVGAREG